MTRQDVEKIISDAHEMEMKYAQIRMDAETLLETITYLGDDAEDVLESKKTDLENACVDIGIEIKPIEAITPE
jgi:hypothetical protein